MDLFCFAGLVGSSAGDLHGQQVELGVTRTPHWQLTKVQVNTLQREAYHQAIIIQS